VGGLKWWVFTGGLVGVLPGLMGGPSVATWFRAFVAFMVILNVVNICCCIRRKRRQKEKSNEEVI